MYPPLSPTRSSVPVAGKTSGTNTETLRSSAGGAPPKKDGMHSRQNDGAFQTPCLSVSASGRTKKRKGLSGVHLTHFLQQTLAGGGLFLLAHDARLFEVLALLHFRQNASLFHLLLEAAQSDIEVVVVFVQEKTSGSLGHTPSLRKYSPKGAKKITRLRQKGEDRRLSEKRQALMTSAGCSSPWQPQPPRQVSQIERRIT